MRMRRPSTSRRLFHLFVALTVLLSGVPGSYGTERASQSAGPQRALHPGQTATLLPDGRWLFVGGEDDTGPLAKAIVWDPTQETVTPLDPAPRHARAWHSATVLPDGTVLLFGGRGVDGEVVAEAEVFSPTTRTFTALSTYGLTPRAHHSATLLTDGQVLVAGGVSAQGDVLPTAERWDFRDPRSAIPNPQSLLVARRDHTAVLLAEGTVVLWGGSDASGQPLRNEELYDPIQQSFTGFPLSQSPAVLNSELRTPNSSRDSELFRARITDRS